MQNAECRMQKVCEEYCHEKLSVCDYPDLISLPLTGTTVYTQIRRFPEMNIPMTDALPLALQHPTTGTLFFGNRLTKTTNFLAFAPLAPVKQTAKHPLVSPFLRGTEGGFWGENSEKVPQDWGI